MSTDRSERTPSAGDRLGIGHTLNCLSAMTPPNGDAADRNRARGVRALEGTPTGRGVRVRPRRMRGASVRPDATAGRTHPGQDLSDPEVGDEPHRTEAARLVPREPRAPRARPSPADPA